MDEYNYRRTLSKVIDPNSSYIMLFPGEAPVVEVDSITDLIDIIKTLDKVQEYLVSDLTYRLGDTELANRLLTEIPVLEPTNDRMSRMVER